MPAPIVWIFLIFASTFASVHNFAVAASLYWYYSWFDIMMHFWGGVLVALGVAMLSSLRLLPVKPTLLVTLVVLFATMILWEVFEWVAGLYNPTTHLMDTSKDIVVGFLGGLTGYALLKRFRK